MKNPENDRKEAFRKCFKCEKVKETSDFYYCKTNRNYQSRCKRCVLDRKRQRYQKDDAFREGRKSYQIIYNKARRLAERWESNANSITSQCDSSAGRKKES